MVIIERFRLTAKKRKTIFPPIPRTRFNDQLKAITELATWTSETGKQRTRRGVLVEGTFGADKKRYRFCDLVSSHIMRRTAITTMLMVGMKEHVVKQISGHSNDSKSFYRYVNLVQSPPAFVAHESILNLVACRTQRSLQFSPSINVEKR